MSTHEGVEHGAGTVTLARVLAALLVLTGIEVLLAYEQVGMWIMLGVLLGLSLVKAALIVAYFMHLKFERFGLFLALVPAVVCFVLLFLSFLTDAVRLPVMRPSVW